MKLATLAPLLLAVLLVGCGGTKGEGKPREYRLVSVLPSPATPGDKVTAYGEFPDDARVSLGNTDVAATPIAGGLELAVPPTTVAGELAVVVSSGNTRLEGRLEVVPRIDGVALEGTRLEIAGAGWPASPSDPTSSTQVLLGGAVAIPTNEGGQLVVELPQNLPYGPLSVQATVGGRSSAPYSLQREAGAVKGKIELPAAISSTTIRPTSTLNTSDLDPTTLVVFHAPGALDWLQLPDLLERRSVRALGATRLRFADAPGARSAQALLQSTSGVRSVEHDAVVRSDGLLHAQADTPARPGEGQWFLGLEGVPEAWRVTKGQGVVVAVVDTGVSLGHPDLKANLLPGKDFVDGDTQPQDTAGHGTHVAGLVAADGKAMGVAPRAKLLPIRALNGESGGSAFAVAQAILWAVDRLEGVRNPNPARVVNLSLGSDAYSEALALAVSEAQAAGAVVVAAAGNSGGYLAYPAALPGVIAVTALAGPTIPYQPWYASKGAGTWVTAYGGDTTQDQDRDGVKDGILSTDLSGYGLRMGTSMAAPQVAGIVALALASGTPPQLVRETLAGTATDLGPLGYDASFGHGLVSGRLATPTSPRAYVLALDPSRKVRAWTLVQADGSYTLSNLPPGESLELMAVSDPDNDRRLGEAGESISPALTFAAKAGKVTPLEPFRMALADGTRSVTLEARP